MTDTEILAAINRSHADLAQRLARVEQGQTASTSSIADLLQRILNKLDSSLPRAVR